MAGECLEERCETSTTRGTRGKMKAYRRTSSNVEEKSELSEDRGDASRVTHAVKEN